MAASPSNVPREGSASISELTFEDPRNVRFGSVDKHALVCVFLRGAADTLNLWVPYADDSYYRLRPSLAIGRPNTSSSAAIRLTDRYALHPALRPLEAAFKEGRLGAIQAVGTDNTSGSHFDCQDQMEHGDAAEGMRAGGGWLGRFLRLHDKERSPLSAVAIGTAIPESLRGAPSVSVMEKIDDIGLRSTKGDSGALARSLSALYGADVTLLGEYGRETLSLFQRIAGLQAGQYRAENEAAYLKDEFSNGLTQIARLIKARVGLEVACIDLGGWDTHFFQGAAEGAQAALIRSLSAGLAAFDADLKDHRSRYTVMVITEFGRRTYENGSLGTDHGRGFAFAALGDKVDGGRVLGPWPFLGGDEGDPLGPQGPGGVAPEVDFRNVFAEVLQASHGLTHAEVGAVFPELRLKHVGLMRQGKLP